MDPIMAMGVAHTIPRIALDKPRIKKVDLKYLKWIMFLCIMSIAMKNNMQSHILLIYKVAVLCKIPNGLTRFFSQLVKDPRADIGYLHVSS